MKELVILLTGALLGMLLGFISIKSHIGDEYNIKRFKQLNRKNRDSDIKNEISPKISLKKPKKGIFKRWKEKRQNKKK